MPLVNQSIETALDVSDSVKIKDDLSRIALAVNSVYGEGQGSKQTINIYSTKSFKVNVAGDYLSCNIKINDGNKLIKVSCRSNLKESSIFIEKGENTVVIEWPINSEEMLIH